MHPHRFGNGETKPNGCPIAAPVTVGVDAVRIVGLIQEVTDIVQKAGGDEGVGLAVPLRGCAVRRECSAIVICSP